MPDDFDAEEWLRAHGGKVPGGGATATAEPAPAAAPAFDAAAWLAKNGPPPAETPAESVRREIFGEANPAKPEPVHRKPEIINKTAYVGEPGISTGELLGGFLKGAGVALGEAPGAFLDALSAQGADLYERASAAYEGRGARIDRTGEKQHLATDFAANVVGGGTGAEHRAVAEGWSPLGAKIGREYIGKPLADVVPMVVGGGVGTFLGEAAGLGRLAKWVPDAIGWVTGGAASGELQHENPIVHGVNAAIAYTGLKVGEAITKPTVEIIAKALPAYGPAGANALVSRLSPRAAQGLVRIGGAVGMAGAPHIDASGELHSALLEAIKGNTGSSYSVASSLAMYIVLSSGHPEIPENVKAAYARGEQVPPEMEMALDTLTAPVRKAAEEVKARAESPGDAPATPTPVEDPAIAASRPRAGDPGYVGPERRKIDWGEPLPDTGPPTPLDLLRRSTDVQPEPPAPATAREGTPAPASAPEEPVAAPEPVQAPEAPPAPPSAPPKAPVEPSAEGPGFTTSTKKRVVAAEREARGASPLDESPAQSFEGWKAEAEKRIAEDSNAPHDLLRKLEEKPRAPTPVERAMLTIHRVNLLKSVRRMDAEGIAAAERGDTAGAEQAAESARAFHREHVSASEIIGHEASAEAGRSLGAIKMEMADDYSITGIENSLRREQGYKKLSPKEATALRDEATKISQRLEKALAEVERLKAEKGTKGGARGGPPRSTYGSRNKLVTREAYDKALAEFSGTTLSAGIDPAKLGAAIKIGAFHAEAGVRNFAEWSKAMIEGRGEFKGLGESVRPYLKAAYDAATKQVHDATVADVTERVKAGRAEGKPVEGMPTEIRKLAELVIRTGVTEREAVVDAVHDILKSADPNISRREVADATSGYGRLRRLNPDEAKVRLREISGELQQISKLQDMAAGKAPLKSGIERQAPTEAQRELTKLVNAAKREGGYDVRSPEAELKTALETTKTRLRNEIRDIDRQIDAKKKDVKGESKVKDDAETKALRQERKEKMVRFKEIFGTPGKTDAQKIEAATKAVEKSIAEQERRIKAGDVFPEQAKDGPTNARLDALRKKREDLGQIVTDMRLAATPRKAKAEAQIKALDAQIAELQRRVKTGDVFPEKPRDKSEDPRVTALKKQRDELRTLASDIRKAAEPGKSQYEKDVEALVKRRTNEAATLREMVESGQLEKPAPVEKTAVKADPRVVAANAEADLARTELANAQFRERERAMSKTKKILRAVFLDIPSLQRMVEFGIDTSFTGLQLGAQFYKSLIPRFTGEGLKMKWDPLKPYRSVKEATGAFGRNENSLRRTAESEARVTMDPLYQTLKRAGLRFSGIGGAPIEEAMRSRIGEKIPVLRQLQRYTTTLSNRERLDNAKAMGATLSRNGEPTPAEWKHIADLVNAHTGSGGPKGGKVGQVIDASNAVMLATRWVVSRFQTALGVHMFHGGTIRTKALAAQEIGRLAAGMMLVYGALGAAGFPIDRDPKSSGFGDVDFGGGTKINLSLGLSSVYTFLNRVYTRLAGSDEEKQAVDDDVIGRFVRTKLHPIAEGGYSLVNGKMLEYEQDTGKRKDATLKNVGQNLVTPLGLGDIYQTMVQQQNIPKGLALGATSMLGARVRNDRFGPKKDDRPHKPPKPPKPKREN